MAEKIPVIYKMGPTENLSNVPIKKGQILVTNDKGKMYIDVADEQRLPVGGTENVIGEKTAEGGEIFNTEYDNVAGGKCFSIRGLNKNLMKNEITRLKEYDMVLNSEGAFSLNNMWQYDIPIITLKPGKYYIKTIGLYHYSGGVSGIETEENMRYGGEAFGTVWYLMERQVIGGPGELIPQDGIFECTEETILRLSWGVTGPSGGTSSRSNYRVFISITEGENPPDNIKYYDYELDSVEGIEIGDIYSLKIGANYDFYGTINNIINNTITVSDYTEGTTTDLTNAIIWFPYKPQLGTKVNGGAQSARGYTTTALNWGSSSEGYNTLAAGRYSHAQNHSTVAGFAASAEGQGSLALAEWSHAQNFLTSALGQGSTSLGVSTVNMSDYFNNKVIINLLKEDIENAFNNASKKFTCAKGYASIAGGLNTLALDRASLSFGEQNISKGSRSIALGYCTIADGEQATVFGFGNQSRGNNNTVFGNSNICYGEENFILGKQNIINPTFTEDDVTFTLLNSQIKNIYMEGRGNRLSINSTYLHSPDVIIFNNNHLEGEYNKLESFGGQTHTFNHIEGYKNTFTHSSLNQTHIEGGENSTNQSAFNITLSHIEGYKNSIQGTLNATHIEGQTHSIQNNLSASHIEGSSNIVYFTENSRLENIHIEGTSNKVYCTYNSNGTTTGNTVHLEGLSNTARASTGGHVGGWNNTINGDCAFAHGHGLKATGLCSFVVGRYNVESNASTPTLSNAARFIVGNGTTESNRSNAFAVYADGHGEIQTQGTTNTSLVQKQYVDALLTKIEKLEAAIVALGGTVA